MKKFILLIFLFAFSNLAGAGEYYYVNSYSSFGNYYITSALYKIDIASKKVVDSLYLGIQGEFIITRPLECIIGQHHYLLSFLACGMIGKNSRLQNMSSFECTVIDESRFRMVAHNTLQSYFLYSDIRISRDTIYADWTDDNPDSMGYFRGSFVLDSTNHSLHVAERIPYRDEFDKPIMVGEFGNPVFLANIGTIKYYWDLREGLEVVLFKADNVNNVLDERTVGNRGNSAVVVGFNPLDSLIYNFSLRYYLETQVPPISSPDFISNNLQRLRLSDFQNVGESVNIEQPSFIANEAGKVAFIDGSFVYYFFEGEGYGSFQPASIFIFDTRTNEATWLRVGWR